jgi:hypothetical protein
MRKVGESYVNLKFDSPDEVQILCDQELPPRGLFESQVLDCKRRRLIVDILKLQPEKRVTYHLYLRDGPSKTSGYSMKLSAEKKSMRFELTNMSDTVELVLVNPSMHRHVHLKLSIFEGHPAQFLPEPPPNEVIRYSGKS